MAKRELIRLNELPIEVTLYWRPHSGQDTTVDDFSFSDPEDDLAKEFKLPPLWKWYCLANSFIVVSTSNDDVIPEQHVKTVQSSIQMAVAEINCSIPVFLRLLHKRTQMFVGVSDDDHIRTHYDIICLRALPANYKCFTGLHEIFKGKVGLTSEPIAVTVRLCFSTNELRDYAVMPPRMSEDVALALPFGIDTDPVKNFVLNCVWPEQSSSWIMHNNHTSFNVQKATSWVLQCEFDDSAIELMADCLDEFSDDLINEAGLLNETEQVYVMGGGSGGGTFGRAKQTWSKLRTEKAEVNNAATIPNEVVKSFLYYLFPDADVDTVHAYADMENRKSVRNFMKEGKH